MLHDNTRHYTTQYYITLREVRNNNVCGIAIGPLGVGPPCSSHSTPRSDRHQRFIIVDVTKDIGDHIEVKEE